MKIPKLNSIVLIEWIDSHTPSDIGWMTIEDALSFAEGDCKVVTVGFVFRVHNGNLTVSSTKMVSGSRVTSLFNIPIGCIKKIRVIK